MLDQRNVSPRARTTVENDQSALLMDNRYRPALRRLLHAYREFQPAAVLVSDGRYAQDHVIGSFLARLDDEVTVARIGRARTDPTEFMSEIVRSIGFDTKQMSLPDLEDVLGMFLKYQRTHRLRTVLVVQHVDAYGPWVLDKLQRLVEEEVSEEFGLIVIIAGPPGILSESAQPILQRITDRGGDSIVLTPFNLSETRNFVRQQLEEIRSEKAAAADLAREFDFDAVTMIHEICSGVPDDIALLCSKCLEMAGRTKAKKITTATVKAVVNPPGPQPETTAPPEPRVDADVESRAPGHLIVKVDQESERAIPINGNAVLIGRDLLCSICIKRAQVSRFHALIANTDDRLHFVDLDSTNGSAVNGKPVQRRILKDKDVIAVGNARIIYVANGLNDSAEYDLDRTDSYPILRPEPDLENTGRR